MSINQLGDHMQDQNHFVLLPLHRYLTSLSTWLYSSTESIRLAHSYETQIPVIHSSPCRIMSSGSTDRNRVGSGTRLQERTTKGGQTAITAAWCIYSQVARSGTGLGRDSIEVKILGAWQRRACARTRLTVGEGAASQVPRGRRERCCGVVPSHSRSLRMWCLNLFPQIQGLKTSSRLRPLLSSSPLTSPATRLLTAQDFHTDAAIPHNSIYKRSWSSAGSSTHKHQHLSCVGSSQCFLCLKFVLLLW